MKKIFYAILLILLIVSNIASAATKAKAVKKQEHPHINSVWLDYKDICNFKESFPVKAGDIVYFRADDIDMGDLLTIETTVTNPHAKGEDIKKYYWQFINHNKKRFTREYSKMFKTRIRIGDDHGWFEFRYTKFSIPKGNKAVFYITNDSYCKTARLTKKIN